MGLFPMVCIGNRGLAGEIMENDEKNYALSYLDKRIEDSLGDFQKDFEGEILVDNLAPKFGGYGSFLPTYERSPGSFLPTYERSPDWFQSETHRAPRSPNKLDLEGFGEIMENDGKDYALSHIDKKLEDILGDCQKYFEGDISAETLGPKYGGYGSFLPTCERSPGSFLPRYERSPDWSQPGTHNVPRSPSNLHLEDKKLEDFEGEVSAANLGPQDESPNNIFQMFALDGMSLLSPLGDNLISIKEKTKKVHVKKSRPKGAALRRREAQLFSLSPKKNEEDPVDWLPGINAHPTDARLPTMATGGKSFRKPQIISVKRGADQDTFRASKRRKTEDKKKHFETEQGKQKKARLSSFSCGKETTSDKQVPSAIAPTSCSSKVSGPTKSCSLPPSRKSQPNLGCQAENGPNILTAADESEGNNFNGGQPINSQGAPNPVQRESVNQADANAIKDAEDFKLRADRLKNSELYFEAALKFLHGASLLESSEMTQAIQIYTSSAKLFEFCAYEYEQSKDMATAALAYKCIDVTYLRVVYSLTTGASRDRHELQTALQTPPLGESSSTSVTGVSPAQVVPGIIVGRNNSSFTRLLHYAQYVHFAMEASRRSRAVFEAAGSELEEGQLREDLDLVKSALDFDFQDVEGLLRLVRVAFESINH